MCHGQTVRLNTDPVAQDPTAALDTSNGDATPQLSINIQSDTPYLSCDQMRQTCVLLTVRAPQDGPQRRLPLDLIAVLDVSGSMTGPKIDLLRETLLSAVRGCHLTHGTSVKHQAYRLFAQVEVLDENDRLSIIKFESSASRLTPLSLMTPAGRELSDIA